MSSYFHVCRYLGTQTKDPFAFKRVWGTGSNECKVKDIKLQLAGEDADGFNIETGQHEACEYIKLFLMSNQYEPMTGMNITREDFETGYYLHTFNLTASLTENEYLFPVVRTGSLRFRPI